MKHMFNCSYQIGIAHLLTPDVKFYKVLGNCLKTNSLLIKPILHNIQSSNKWITKHIIQYSYQTEITHLPTPRSDHINPTYSLSPSFPRNQLQLLYHSRFHPISIFWDSSFILQPGHRCTCHTDHHIHPFHHSQVPNNHNHTQCTKTTHKPHKNIITHTTIMKNPHHQFPAGIHKMPAFHSTKQIYITPSINHPSNPQAQTTPFHPARKTLKKKKKKELFPRRWVNTTPKYLSVCPSKDSSPKIANRFLQNDVRGKNER